MAKIIINSSVFFILYIIPLMVFAFYSFKGSLHKGLLVLLSSVYLLLSIFTASISYNLLPFITVVCSIILISKEEKGVFNLKEFSIFKALKYSIFTYITSLAISLLYTLILVWLNIKINDQKIINIMLELPVNKFIILVPIIIIFAPVIEEFVFRWFLYDRFFKKYMGIYGAAVLSSIIFALAHFNLKSFVVIMILGLINCWLLNNKGYWYAVFNHGFFNSISVIILLFDKIT